MARYRFTFKEGDSDAILTFQVRDASGSARDLTGATVAFSLVDPTGATVTVGGTASVADAANGIVSYDFAAADTSAGPGTYLGEFALTWPDTDTSYHPRDGNIEVNVVDSPAR